MRPSRHPSHEVLGRTLVNRRDSRPPLVPSIKRLLLTCVVAASSCVLSACPFLQTPASCDDELCGEYCTSVGEELARPAPPVALESASCEDFGVIGSDPAEAKDYGPSCICRLAATGGAILVLHGEDQESCVITGKTGACLYATSEFPGCSIGDDQACEAPCGDAISRRNEDFGRQFDDLQVKQSSCVDGQSCNCLFSVDGRDFERP